MNTTSRITITLPAGEAPLEVDAEIIGQWAVHPCIGKDNQPIPERWSITLISNGYRLPVTVSDYDMAAELCHRLEPVDVAGLVERYGVGNIPENDPVMKRAVKIIRRWADQYDDYTVIG